jgi:hypothetical protein
MWSTSFVIYESSAGLKSIQANPIIEQHVGIIRSPLIVPPAKLAV